MGSVQTTHLNSADPNDSATPSEKQTAFARLLREKYQPRLRAGLRVRTLEADDYERGYLPLLAQLTTVGDVTKAQFEEQFRNLMISDAYFIAVVEDVETAKILGSATLVLELKFIHACGARGRVEDVVVDATARGNALGQLLNEALADAARHLFGVYKLSLECKDSLIPFYEKFGYKLDAGNNFLVQRICD